MRESVNTQAFIEDQVDFVRNFARSYPRSEPRVEHMTGMRRVLTVGFCE